MGIFNIFGKKRGRKAETEPKTDEEIIESDNGKLEKAIRRKRAEIHHRRLEQLNERLEEIRMEQEIADAEDSLAALEGDDEEDVINPADAMNPDMLMMGLLTKVLNKPAAAPVPQVAPSTKLESRIISYSDEQIRDLKSKIPKPYLNKLQKCTDEEISGQLLERFPDVDNDTIKRAVVILRQ